MIAVPKFLPGVLVLISVASLAACAAGNSAADLAPAAPQQAAPAPAAAGAPAAPPPSAAAAHEGRMTPEEVKTQCWMKYEADKKIKNIDQRLALVEKCVAETSGNQPPPRN